MNMESPLLGEGLEACLFEVGVKCESPCNVEKSHDCEGCAVCEAPFLVSRLVEKLQCLLEILLAQVDNSRGPGGEDGFGEFHRFGVAVGETDQGNGLVKNVV